ncbi:MAG: HIRAN domain-containing protein [Hyphomonadaceae bacterium]
MEISIDGPGTFAIDVVGVSRRQDVLAAVVERQWRGGRAVTVDAVLVLENSNPHDANAVRVEIDGALVGYLSRENARRYRGDLAAAAMPGATVRCKARVRGGFETEMGERGYFGVRLDLPELGA